MRIARPLRWQLLPTAQREEMKMETTNSQSTVSADAGVVAAAARLDYAVDLLCTFLGSVLNQAKPCMPHGSVVE